MYKQSGENNPLPAAMALSAIGGVAGLGTSLLSKKQRKHKLRNTLIGATALPAAFLAANKWGPQSVKDKLDAFSGKVYDYMPSKLQAYAGGKTVSDAKDVKALGDKRDTATENFTNAERARKELYNKQYNNSTPDYLQRQKDIEAARAASGSLYSDMGMAAKQEQYNTDSAAANEKYKKDRERISEEHASKVNSAKKTYDANQKDRKNIIDKQVRDAHKDSQEEIDRYHSFLENSDLARANLKTGPYAFLESDRLAREAEQARLTDAQAALATLNDPSKKINPFSEGVKKYKTELDALNARIKGLGSNPKSDPDYAKERADAWQQQVAGNHNLETISTKDPVSVAAAKNADDQAKAKILTKLKAERERLKGLYTKQRKKELGFRFDQAGNIIGEWTDKRKLNAEIAEAKSNIEAANKKEQEYNKKLDEQEKVLATNAGHFHPNAHTWYTQANTDFDNAQKELQAIMDSKPDFTGVDSAFNEGQNKRDTEWQNAQSDYGTKLWEISEKLRNLQDIQKRLDAEDAQLADERQNADTALTAARNANSLAVQNYNDAADKETNRRNRREDLALKGLAGGTGAVALLSLIQKLRERKRRKREISPEAYADYLAEEGLA